MMGTAASVDYTTFTKYNMKYLVMCWVYTAVGSINKLYHVCPPVRKIIHSLKLVQADNTWYNYYLILTPDLSGALYNQVLLSISKCQVWKPFDEHTQLICIAYYIDGLTATVVST